MPVGASSADAQDDRFYVSLRREAGTSLLILFGDSKRSLLVLGGTRTLKKLIIDDWIPDQVRNDSNRKWIYRYK